MRPLSPTHRLSRLPARQAAQLVVHLEQVWQFDWGRVSRTDDRRLVLRYGPEPDDVITFGEPDDPLETAGRALCRRWWPAVHRRLRTDDSFRRLMLKEAAQALLDNELGLAIGLMRRIVDAGHGFETLAAVTGIHTKSLVRMLGRHGNPTARHLLTIVAGLATLERVRLSVEV